MFGLNFGASFLGKYFFNEHPNTNAIESDVGEITKSNRMSKRESNPNFSKPVIPTAWFASTKTQSKRVG